MLKAEHVVEILIALQTALSLTLAWKFVYISHSGLEIYVDTPYIR